MVKLRHPLLSESASGSIAGGLTFSMRPSGPQARIQRPPSGPASAAQSAERSLYREAVEAWQAESPETKADYREQAKAYDLTGYNLYLSIYLQEHQPASAGAIYGVAVYGAAVYGS